MATMKPWARRSLTPGEHLMVDETFAGGVDVARVRVLSVPIPAWMKPRPFVPGDPLRRGVETIVWARAPEDFSDPDVPLRHKGIFIHEMTHVWQCQQGVKLIRAKMRALGKKAYEYVLPSECPWSDFNIEQQAMIVQDDFLHRWGGECPYPPEAYEAVLPFRGCA
jgi:hypothetical protein